MMSEAMKKELQEGFEKALASFEKRQEAQRKPGRPSAPVPSVRASVRHAGI